MGLVFGFRKAITLNADKDADVLWDELEESVRKCRYIIIEGCMRDYGHEQIIARFVDKYKAFVDYFYTDMKIVYGRTYIKLKSIIRENTTHTYSQLIDSYTKEYYMNDCGGYDVFSKSGGKKMELRLQDVYNLIKPEAEEKILDIGCGRGELAFALSQSGACVVGVDYSEAAISIARKTYGENCDRLQYICADIFKLKEMYNYDKIVMADVVEHIDQEILENIFAKIADSMSEKGVLVVHTAPNSDYYAHTWPLIRERAALMGFYLQKNPRSYYEQLMHINEQSPKRLERTLRKYFPEVHVWTGSVTEINAAKSEEESYQDNQIFAYACMNKDMLCRTIQEIDCRPQYEKTQIEISAEDSVWDNNEMDILVTVDNRGEENLTSRRKWPIYVAYHIYDVNNNLLLYDGDRTRINQVIRENDCAEIVMKFKVPEELVQYSILRICITLVAEGVFWFDCEGKNCTFITLKKPIIAERNRDGL